MIQDLWKVVGISRAAQIVPVKGELGVILPITIAMKLRGTVMEILKVGSGVQQGQFLLQQFARPINLNVHMAYVPGKIVGSFSQSSSTWMIVVQLPHAYR